MLNTSGGIVQKKMPHEAQPKERVQFLYRAGAAVHLFGMLESKAHSMLKMVGGDSAISICGNSQKLDWML